MKILKKYLQSEFSLNIKRNLVDFHLNLFKAEKNPVINVLEFYLLIQIRNYFRSFFFLILYKWEGRVRTLSTTNCNNKLKIKINSIICTVHYLKHCCWIILSSNQLNWTFFRKMQVGILKRILFNTKFEEDLKHVFEVLSLQGDIKFKVISKLSPNFDEETWYTLNQSQKSEES